MNATATRDDERWQGDGSARWPQDADALHEDIEHHRREIDRTLSALESKFSAQDLTEQLMRQLRGGPGSYFSELFGAAKHNPLPLALVGVGLGWLMLGGSHGGGGTAEAKDRDSGAGRRESEPSADTERVVALPDDTSLGDLYAFCLRREYPFYDDEVECLLYDDLGPEAAAAWAGTGRHPAEGEGTRHVQGDAGERFREHARAAGGEAKARIDRTRERMGEATEEAKIRVARARDNARRRAMQAKHAAARGAREAARQTSDFVDRYPLSLVALGIATGAALGAGAPSTRAEDRWLGKASDAFLHGLGDKARDATESAKDAARAAGEAASEEAHRQGVHPEELKERARHAGEEVKEHARHAGEELKERARQAGEEASGSARHEAERHGATGAGVRERARDARERIEHVAGAAGEAARRELEDDDREHPREALQRR
jgi:ElaB/YqjD/DUF883 family membrane-anchored ribosome-binding protein